MDYEAKAADQVPLLMRMNKDDLALEKAIMSGDTDLGELWVGTTVENYSSLVIFEVRFCIDVVAQKPTYRKVYRNVEIASKVPNI